MEESIFDAVASVLCFAYSEGLDGFVFSGFKVADMAKCLGGVGGDEAIKHEIRVGDFGFDPITR